MRVDYAISPCNTWLYKYKEPDRWYRFKKDILVRGKQYYEENGEEINMYQQNNIIPVDLYNTDKQTFIKLRSVPVIKSIKRQNKDNNINQPFNKFINNIDNWMKNTTKNIEKLNNHLFISESVEPIIMCCDGGLFNNKGSYGIIATRKNKTMFECHNRIPNTYNSLSSH
jgi:hypothetical protein